MNKNLKNVLVISTIILIMDQIIKIIITDKMSFNQEFPLIKNLLSLNLVKNEGAAFSILMGNRFLLIGIALTVLVLLCVYISKQEYFESLDLTIFSLLIGGLLGNLVDRIVRGYVIDYISLKFGTYLFPIFNFADICIVLSALIIIVTVIKGEVWN